MGGSLNLQLREGENVEELASRICKEYHIPMEQKGPLLSLIKN
jgi:hypothetical protein